MDGSHAYEYVVNDTEKAMIMMNPNSKSVIVLHDYGRWDGVTQALSEYYVNDPRFKNLRHIEGTSLAVLLN